MIPSRAVTEMEITANRGITPPLLDYLSGTSALHIGCGSHLEVYYLLLSFYLEIIGGTCRFKAYMSPLFSLQLFTNLGKAKVGLRFEAVKYDDLVNFIFLC